MTECIDAYVVEFVEHVEYDHPRLFDRRPSGRSAARGATVGDLIEAAAEVLPETLRVGDICVPGDALGWMLETFALEDPWDLWEPVVDRRATHRLALRLVEALLVVAAASSVEVREPLRVVRARRIAEQLHVCAAVHRTVAV